MDQSKKEITIKRKQRMEESQFSYKTSRLDESCMKPESSSSQGDSKVPLSVPCQTKASNERGPGSPLNQHVITLDELLAEKPVHNIKWIDICRMSVGPLPEYSLTTFKDSKKDEIAVNLKKDLGRLSISEIKSIMAELKPTLRGVFSGNIRSERHIAYNRGLKQRRELDMGVPLHNFSEEHGDVISKELLDMFCSRPEHTVHFDYTMRVLLPEALIRIVANVRDISFDEASKLLDR